MEVVHSRDKTEPVAAAFARLDSEAYSKTVSKMPRLF